ncbi:hypothetical protein [Streptomyces aurantiacus]|uniref:hypothetical protein n=1 Tax=Streptomyces aurantiacus TaxID=47760 RepID=UPI0012FF5509|nr:hypothetical protein [Streptomyces aurantiacus]
MNSHALPAGTWNRPAAVGHQPVAHPSTAGGAWTVHAVRALVETLVTVACTQRRAP